MRMIQLKWLSVLMNMDSLAMMVERKIFVRTLKYNFNLQNYPWFVFKTNSRISTHSLFGIARCGILRYSSA